MESKTRENDSNQYEGLLEAWKVELIVQLARRRGFRKDQILDLQQEIVPAILAFQYNPQNESGASEKTALTALIIRKLNGYYRRESRGKDRANVLMEKTRSGHFHNGEEIPVTGDVEEGRNVRDVVANLDVMEQELCQLISDGLTQTEIAVRLGVSERTVRNMLKEVRKRFERAGFSE